MMCKKCGQNEGLSFDLKDNAGFETEICFECFKKLPKDVQQTAYSVWIKAGIYFEELKDE